VTIDGDTSTNDSFVLIATHKAGNAQITALSSAEGEQLKAALLEVAQKLAQAIVRDGEGATKFISVKVEGGKNEEECRLVAYSIAHSPLVKTAFLLPTPTWAASWPLWAMPALPIWTRPRSICTWTMCMWWSTAAATLPTRKKTASA
jgi:hypothetical protein